MLENSTEAYTARCESYPLCSFHSYFQIYYHVSSWCISLFCVYAYIQTYIHINIKNVTMPYFFFYMLILFSNRIWRSFQMATQNSNNEVFQALTISCWALFFHIFYITANPLKNICVITFWHLRKCFCRVCSYRWNCRSKAFDRYCPIAF